MIPVMLALLLYTLALSLYDLRTGKVPNWATLPLLAAGVLAHFPGTFPVWIASLFVFTAWHSHQMGAGDAKLWMALFWAIPPEQSASIPLVLFASLLGTARLPGGQSSSSCGVCMHTDLFSALLNRENRRGHPILAAMLYSFCPTAARWWIAGADPEPIFDPVWQAIKDWNSGTNLTEQLERYELERVFDVVSQYLKDVKRYRKNHKDGLPAPELLPSFKGGKIPSEYRFEPGRGIQNLDGNWDNLFVYVRTWAFLLEDWRQSIHIDKGANYNLKMETVALTLPDYRQPVEFETLAWRVQVGHVTEVRIGLLVVDGEHDLLRFGLLSRSSLQGDRPWPNLPLVYGLDRKTGEGKLADLPVSNKEFPKLVAQLAEAAKEGPYPPLNALQRPSVCKGCGYQHFCYHNSNLTPHLLSEK